MKTFNFGEQASKANKAGLEPSVAGALSLVPGLGQLYNGDRLKGWLFLEVGAINFAILAVILCADSLSTGMAQFAVNHHFNANYALLKQLASFKLGHPGATLLFALCLAFIAFSVRDAYDRATNIRRREIYSGHFLELSEAASGSYLAHFALMGALLLLSVFLLIPAPPRTQVTEIEFVSQPERPRIKPPETTRVSTNNSRAEGIHRKELPVRTNQGQTAPSQASASRSVKQTTSVSKPQPKPEVKTQPADAARPAPIKAADAPKPPTPIMDAHPVVRPPAPTPISAKPMPEPPMPARPMPIKSANLAAPTPMVPALKPIPARAVAAATFARSDVAPVPNGVGASAPKPLLAFNVGSPAASSFPALQPSNLAMGGPSSSNHSWMSGKSPSSGKPSTGTAAPSVDASSFNGTGDSHAKPTLADTSSGRSGPGKGTSHGEAPKPVGAKSGPAPGDVLAVLPKLAAPVGDPNGGLGNADPNSKSGTPRVATVEHSPEFGVYLANLQRRIRRAWGPPRQPTSKSSIIVFTIGLGGELLGLHLQHSSGDHSMDEAAIQAIRNSAPFPHLPQYSPDSVDVQFTFDYNVFNGGRQF